MVLDRRVGGGEEHALAATSSSPTCARIVPPCSTTRSSSCGLPAEHRAQRPMTPGQAGGSPSRSGIGGLGAGEFMPIPAGVDQRTRLVIDGGACSRQGGPANAVVVAAQQQVNRVPASRCRRHHHRDHRPGRTAASAPSKSKRLRPVTRTVHRHPGDYAIPVQEPCPHTKSVTRRRSSRQGPSAHRTRGQRTSPLATTRRVLTDPARRA